jgi:hypothetical protein
MSHTPEQRRIYADGLAELVREWLVERGARFELEIQRGVDWCQEVTTASRTPVANDSFTITLRINGGAEEREGRPILRTPGIVRPSEP